MTNWIDLERVMEITGLKRDVTLRLGKGGNFPVPSRQKGRGNRYFWDEAEVNLWMQQRAAAMADTVTLADVRDMAKCDNEFVRDQIKLKALPEPIVFEADYGRHRWPRPVVEAWLRKIASTPTQEQLPLVPKAKVPAYAPKLLSPGLGQRLLEALDIIREAVLEQTSETSVS